MEKEEKEYKRIGRTGVCVCVRKSKKTLQPAAFVVLVQKTKKKKYSKTSIEVNAEIAEPSEQEVNYIDTIDINSINMCYLKKTNSWKNTDTSLCQFIRLNKNNAK